MSQNQGNRQKNARQKANITGGQRNGDMIRMMDLVTGVSSSDYNGKWIEFVNAKFGTNINNVSGAKYFLATQTGFENFDAMTQFDSLFYDGTSGNTNPNDSGASAITVQLVPSTNMELATKGDAAGKLTIKGKSTGTAYLMLDVGDPVVGQEYVFRYDADWSRLRNDGKDVFVGIGLRSTTDSLHWAGLEGDGVGATGVTYSRIYGSNLFSKGTAPTLVTVTAASEATREGSNWLKFIYYSGNTYSFYVGSSVTSAGTRDANDIAWTLYGVSGASLSGYSGTVQNFGIGVYTPFSDRGNFTMNITRYVFATANTQNPVVGPQPSSFSAVTWLTNFDNNFTNFANNNKQLTGSNVTYTTAVTFREYARSARFNPAVSPSLGFIDPAFDPLPLSGNFTVELSVYLLTVASNQALVSSWGTPGNRGFIIGFDTANDQFYMATTNNGTTIVSVASAFGKLASTKYDLAFQRRGQFLDIYVNGTRENTLDYGGAYTIHDSGLVTEVGKQNNSTERLDGLLSGLRMCNEAIIGDVGTYEVGTLNFPES